MKLITYSKDNSTSCGILTGDFIIDIPSAWPAPNPPHSVKEILEMHSMPYGKGRPCLAKLAGLIDSAGAQIPLDSVKLLAPIPKPGKVIALAGNYSEHIKEAGLAKFAPNLLAEQVIYVTSKD